MNYRQLRLEADKLVSYLVNEHRNHTALIYYTAKIQRILDKAYRRYDRRLLDEIFDGRSGWKD